ncbi:HNH endonuclease [Ralstonia insidiosa]|uniref:HNH nuclease domain-containing protein n=1 Tax=Ralstonia insidiosa TaxID=190721 RepID=A0A848P8Z8_9RALS|nr:HNH endonuclease signature motif containing protein [Ralstonia insidiosa]NMV41937.1 hypothetical protein [Ralstonia insidiosa]
MARIFAYHKTYEHGDFWHSYYWTKATRVQTGDILYVISGDRPRRPTYFLEGRYQVVSIDPPDNGVRKLNLRAEAQGPKPLSISAQAWFDNHEFHSLFTSGQSMNTVRPEYAERFDEMLRGSEDQPSLVADLHAIDNLDLDATEREILALARVGQGEFRANVIEAWGLGEVCAVTGARLRSLLVASHVLPWRDCATRSERLDGANGILLCAHVDRLFDQNLISFAADGEIMFGPTLQQDAEAVADLASLGVTAQARLNFVNLNPEAHERLAQHLDDHRAKLR